MANKRFQKALVEWLNDADIGRLEIIDSSWIKHFNASDWKDLPDEERPESEVVYYKSGKKPTSGVYPCYDAKVLGVSSNTQTLSNLKIEILAQRKRDNPQEKAGSSGGWKSSMRKTTGEHSDENSSIDESSDNEEKKQTVKTIRKKKNKADELLFQKLEKSGSKEKKSDLDTTQGTGQKQRAAAVMDATVKIPIFKGSPYLVDPVLYNHSKQQGCQQFVVGMLHQLFPTKVLVVSNIKGGKSEIERDGERRWALDKQRRLAITTAAKSLFPNVSLAAMHRYMSGNINSLRLRKKQKGLPDRLVAKGRNDLEGTSYVPDDEDSEEEQD